MIKLTILGKCISKDNSKIFNRQGRPFLTQKYRDYEEYVRWQAKSQYHGQPLSAPLQVKFSFYMPDKRHADLLNLPKSIADALTGVVWVDDKQIVWSSLMIDYDKNKPRVEIIVSEKIEV